MRYLCNAADNTSCEMKPVNESSVGNGFPFRHGYTSVMTVSMDEEGIKMIVDGTDIATFPKSEVIISHSHGFPIKYVFYLVAATFHSL